MLPQLWMSQASLIVLRVSWSDGPVAFKKLSIILTVSQFAKLKKLDHLAVFIERQLQNFWHLSKPLLYLLQKDKRSVDSFYLTFS